MPWVAPSGGTATTWTASTGTTATWTDVSDATSVTYAAPAAPDPCDGLSGLVTFHSLTATGGALGIDTAYRLLTPGDWCVQSTHPIRLVTSNLVRP